MQPIAPVLRRTVWYGAAMLVFTACYERAPVGPRDKLAIDVPPGTVQVILQQDQTTPGDTATFIVRVVANGVKVGAYQGSVTFTPGTLELVNVTAPTSNGELYIVNPAGFANGRIRFAAYTTAAAFNDTEAFRFRAVAVRPLSETLLTGRLDVAGEPTGAALSRTTLRASHGLRDASTNLVILP